MKNIITVIFFLIFSATSFATTYYISSTDGDDNRSSFQAQNMSTPWKSLDKLNASFGIILPGDQILFKCGDIFYGSINVTASGINNTPITFSSYGSGVKPVITGLTTMSNWTNIGNGIYESYKSVLGSSLNMVVVNNKVTPVGRYPNSGYLAIQSHYNNQSVSNNNLSGANWTGAELVVRTRHFVMDRTPIVYQSGSTISYGTPLTYEPEDNFGFFIQRDIRTLDQLGEWYYNPNTHKLDMYFGNANPNSFDVKASFLNSIVTISNVDNIVFSNLAFMGSNSKTFDISSSSNSKIINCDINYSGTDAIVGSATTYMTVESNTITNSNNNGISFAYDCNYASFRYNSIRNTTTFAGMCSNGNTTGQAIFIRGNNNLIQSNSIDSSGFTAISFDGDYNVIKNNYITTFNFVKDDGGAIYTVNNNNQEGSGRVITGNIVLNGIGANDGADGNLSADAIYLDDNSSGVEISNNTTANCNNNGIYLHDSHEVNILNNTSYNNNNSQVILKYDNIAPQGKVRNVQMTGNVFVSKTANQVVGKFQSILNDYSQMGYLNNNYYCRPINDVTSLWTRDVNGIETNIDLKTWQTQFSQDAASKLTAVQIAPYKLNSVSSYNMVSNGDFNSDISGWYAFSTASNYNSQWNSGGRLDGGAYQGYVNANGTSDFSPVVSVGNISSSKQYLLRFSAISSDDAVFTVFLRQTNYPYQTISDVKSFHITPGRKEYEFLFSYPSSETDGSIGFETASQHLYFWLDNVKLSEASATVTNPSDSIRFEINPGSTIKSITLDKNYVDVKNNKYSGTISIQPNSSLILIADNSKAVVKNNPPGISIQNPINNAVFNTASNIQINTLSFPGSDDGYITKVDFYINGNYLGSDFRAPFNFSMKNTYLPGTYQLTVKATDNTGAWAMSQPVNIISKTLKVNISGNIGQSEIADSGIPAAADVMVGPNPATNQLSVRTEGIESGKPLNISIFSMGGMEVKRLQANSSQTLTNIDISGLSAGVYILKLNTGDRTINKKFVKN